MLFTARWETKIMQGASRHPISPLTKHQNLKNLLSTQRQKIERFMAFRKSIIVLKLKFLK